MQLAAAANRHRGRNARPEVSEAESFARWAVNDIALKWKEQIDGFLLGRFDEPVEIRVEVSHEDEPFLYAMHFYANDVLLVEAYLCPFALEYKVLTPNMHCMLGNLAPTKH
mgnify:CR=1 FL=1